MVILLVGANLTLFAIYQQANPNLPFPQQLMSYLQSNTFNVVTLTTFLPILLALANELFNIGETAEQRIYDKELALSDLRRAAIDELASNWNDIYSAGFEVVFFNAEGDQTKIRKSRIKLSGLTVPGVNAFTQIITEFFDLVEAKSVETGFTQTDLDICIRYFNLILASSMSVAALIGAHDWKENPNVIREVQSSLGVVLQGVKILAQIHIFRSLYSFNELLGPNVSPEKADQLRKQISESIDFLKNQYDEILKLQDAHDVYFPSAQGEEVDAARAAAKSYQRWIRPMIKKDPTILSQNALTSSPEYSNLMNAITLIPLAKKVECANAAYSPLFIEQLAEVFFVFLLKYSLQFDVPLQF
jgi:hypothetical protein